MIDKKLRELIDNRTPGLILIITVLAIIEFGIFILCMAYSADHDRVKIYDSKNTVIYEDIYNANDISEFKKLYGIRSFKKEGYTIQRIGVENAFPTRAWIALSVCIPLVLILFIVFIVRVFEDIFQLKKKPRRRRANAKNGTTFEETRFERLFTTLGRLNIYAMSGGVLLIVFLYWMVPDLLIYLSRISYQTISELKWVILGLVIFGGLFLVLRTIFNHRTKIEIIKQQADIQKNRDLLTIENKLDQKLLTEAPELGEEGDIGPDDLDINGDAEEEIPPVQ